MIKLDDSLLQELGLAVLSPEEKKKMLAHIYETLEMRVGMELAKQMTDAQLSEFEQFINQNDEPGALRWLETNFPNYKDVVAAEFEKLKAEVKQVAPQIVASSMQAQQMQPQMQQPQQQQPMAGQYPPQQQQYQQPMPSQQQQPQMQPQPNYGYPQQPMQPQQPQPQYQQPSMPGQPYYPQQPGQMPQQPQYQQPYPGQQQPGYPQQPGQQGGAQSSGDPNDYGQAA